MKLFSIKNLALTGALSVAGLGLIGVGAHAVFTQNTTSGQTIVAGTMNVTLTGTGSTGNGTATINLPSPGPVGSSFVSVDPVTITNNGNIPVTEVALSMSDSNNNGTLQDEAFACFYSDSELLANEPLTTIEGYGPGVVAGSILPGDTDSYTVVIYAGTVDNGCGNDFTGFSGGTYVTDEGYSGSPAFGDNTTDSLATAGLTNGAEGGTIIPTLTLTYNG